MKLIVFAGSTRSHSWNRKLACVAADLARTAGADVTHFELGDFELPLYNADLEAGNGDRPAATRRDRSAARGGDNPLQRGKSVVSLDLKQETARANLVQRGMSLALACDSNEQ